jgi:chaperonin GroEL (HSP60 family)
MNVRPLHDRIVVQRIEEGEQKIGGIIIPDTAKEKPQQGTVIAVGSGKSKDDGTRVPLDVKAGDTILFGKYSGQEITIDGDENVVLDKKYGSPTITKDGVTVAKEIALKDPLENMGAQMVREVASKTSDTAGDGTTTATVLAQAIYREGAKNVAAGANPMDVKRGIEEAVEALTAALKKMAKPVSGNMVAQVGTISMKEKKARVEDAMHATKAAVEEGIAPGGGVALLRAAKVLTNLKLGGDQQIGVNIVARAIEEPMRWIASNAGQEGSIVVQKVREMKEDEGFNALTDTYENLIKVGVIDPAKVVRSALQNASSIASLLLTTEALICDSPEEKKAAT